MHRFLRELRFLNIVIISACARLPIIKITVSVTLSVVLGMVVALFMVAIIVCQSVGMTDDIVILSCGLGSSNLWLSPPKTKGIYKRCYIKVKARKRMCQLVGFPN